jgi:ribonuclease D
LDLHLHQNDLPEGLDFGAAVAIDTETMGLNVRRDRLCLAQLSAGDGVCHLVQFSDRPYPLGHYLGVTCQPVYCTKVASKLARTFTDRHGLKDLCRDLLGVELSKQQQTSDWGAAELTREQLKYAASDVLYLHRLRDRLDEILAREGRRELAQACFEFLPTRAALDRIGWEDTDVFAH